jgi:hypothetical protein
MDCSSPRSSWSACSRWPEVVYRERIQSKKVDEQVESWMFLAGMCWDDSLLMECPGFHTCRRSTSYWSGTVAACSMPIGTIDAQFCH